MSHPDAVQEVVDPPSVLRTIGHLPCPVYYNGQNVAFMDDKTWVWRARDC